MPWHWSQLSEHTNITWEIIRDNPNMPWDWRNVSGNPNITWQIIQANPDKRWNWSWISRNPNITWEIIQANPDASWDWYHICCNKFTSDKKYHKWNYGKNYRWLLPNELKDIILIFWIGNCHNIAKEICRYHSGSLC